jgi:hypothetical protein
MEAVSLPQKNQMNSKADPPHLGPTLKVEWDTQWSIQIDLVGDNCMRLQIF